MASADISDLIAGFGDTGHRLLQAISGKTRNTLPPALYTHSLLISGRTGVGKRLLLTNIAQHLGIPLTRIHLARILASGNRYTALSRMLSHAGDRPTLVWLADAELFRGLGCHVVEGFLDRVRGMPGCVVVLSTRYADRVAVGLRSRVDDHVELAASGDRGKRFRLCRWFAQGSLDHRVIEDVAGQTLGRTAAETFALLADLAERRGSAPISDKTGVRWDDVGGLHDVIAELQEAIVWPLQRSEQFRRLGIRPPRGVLLHGPPGTGKTLLAKAAASEVQANFIA
ncbi:hypothetical protein IW150_001956, partial [Coemansia sp. RSA 2607]